MDKDVLLIDDNPIDLMINEKTIERYNKKLNIFKAASGEEALNLLSSGEVKPNCILLDIKMPIMNGFEFLDELDKLNIDKNFEIHMLSSSIDPSDLQEAEDREIVGSYIEKPITPEKLAKIQL